MTPKYLHFRLFEKGDTNDVASREGATVAYIQEDGVFKYAVAMCGRNDNYSKRLGRTISKNRLEAGLVQVSDVTDHSDFVRSMDSHFDNNWNYYRR